MSIAGEDGQTHLDTEIATIDIIAEKEISRIGRIAADLEKLHKIKVLAMNVAAYGDGSIHFEQIRLCPQHAGPLFENP